MSKESLVVMLSSTQTGVPIQLGQSGPIIKSAADISVLRQEFRRQNHIRLPKLIEPNLLKLIKSWIDRGEFRPKTHTDVGREVVLSDPKALNLIDFLINNHEFFRVVQEITECGRIGCFISRVYRMIPNSGHYDNWHRDLIGPRLVAFSLNLSPEPYLGGILQMRDRHTQRILHEIENIGYGDAILFKLAPDLQHRVTDVTGVAAKTAYAGWFCSEPDFQYDLGKQMKSNNGPSRVDPEMLLTAEFSSERKSVNGSGSISMEMSDKLQFVVQVRQAKACRTSN